MSRRSLATSEAASRPLAAVPAASTIDAGRRSAGNAASSGSGLDSTSCASAASSSATAVRSAAEERLAQRMCPPQSAPSMRSMLALSPISLKGASLPVPSWHAFAMRRHSEQQKSSVQCGGRRARAASSAVSPARGVSSSRRHTASAWAARVRGPKS